MEPLTSYQQAASYHLAILYNEMMKISGLCEVTEMKTYTKPPSGLQLVLASYIWLLVGRYEHVRSNPAARIPISHDWNTCKYMISSASHFMVALKYLCLPYVLINLPEENILYIKYNFLSNPATHPYNMKKVSKFAHKLTEYLLGIVKCFDMLRSG